MTQTVVCKTALLLAAVALCTPALADDYKYTKLKAPGGVETRALAVNDARQVAGTYTLPNGKVRMFVWKDGVFKTYKAPAPYEDKPIVPVAISPIGLVAGTYGGKTILPFQLQPGADAVETISYPTEEGERDVTPTSVLHTDLPEKQQVCGHFFQSSDGVTYGFYSTANEWVSANNPNARVTTFTSCGYDKQAGFGVLAGNYVTDRQHGFEYPSTAAIDPPGSTETWLTFINDNRDLGGHAFDRNRKKFGWVRRGGDFTKYKFPDASDTSVTRSLDEVVFGEFADGTGGSHAFVFNKGKYREASLDGTDVTLTSVGYDGSFVGSFQKDGKTFGYIATCEAGPGKCKP